MFNFKLISSILLVNLIIQICHTSEVIEDETNRGLKLREYAKRLKKFIHDDRDPCKGLIKYTCGDKHRKIDDVIDNDSLAYEIDQDFVKILNENDSNLSKSELKMKDYVISCENKLKNIQEQFKNFEIAKQMGGWPILDDKWDPKNFDFVVMFGIMNAYKIQNILHGEYKNAQIYYDLYDEKDMTTSLIKDDLKQLKLFTEEQINNVSNELMEFKDQISKIKYKIKPEVFTRDELQEVAGNISYDKHFETFFGMKKEAQPWFTIRVDSLERIHGYMKLLNDYDKRVLGNYLMWRTIHDGRKILLEENCSTKMNFDVLGPVTTKLLLRKGISKTGEKIFLDARRETLLLSKKKKESLNEKQKTQIDEMEKVLENQIDDIEHRDKWYSNQNLDAHYNDLIIKSDSYFQNVYNCRFKENTVHLSKYKVNKMENLHYLFRYLQNLQYGPDIYNFQWLGYSFWTRFIEITYKSNLPMSCVPSHCEREVKRNEVLSLQLEVYRNWMEKNSVLSLNTNAILSEFKWNNEQFLMLYSTLNVCPDDTISLETQNSDVVNSVFVCK